MVGGGGKSSALRLLASERAAVGERVVVTTTTNMYRRELEAVGPVVLETDPGARVDRMRETLARRSTVAVAGAPVGAGKVAGLPAVAVDALREASLADCLIVEADGSRGRSLKAFGTDEPAAPAATTVIVQVAGVDVVGRPLETEHVHRAGLVSAELGVPMGSAVTTSVFVEALRRQLRRLRQGWPAARIVTLLNKVEGPAAEGVALDAADRLGGSSGAQRRSPEDTLGGGGARPDAVVIASLQEGRFARFSAAER